MTTKTIMPSDALRLVTLEEIAEVFGLDRSHTRRYAIARGFKWRQQRLPHTGNQLCNVLSAQEAERLYALREAEGFKLAGRPSKPRLLEPHELLAKIEELENRVASLEQKP